MKSSYNSIRELDIDIERTQQKIFDRKSQCRTFKGGALKEVKQELSRLEKDLKVMEMLRVRMISSSENRNANESISEFGNSFTADDYFHSLSQKEGRIENGHRSK